MSDRVMKKQYSKCCIYLYDESMFEYNMKEWGLYRDDEWVEAIKLDGTEMNCFAVQNVARICFYCDVKSEKIADVVILKPVV